MQIHVDHIETHVAGFDLAENRIQIRAVVIQQPARIMNDFLDVLNLGFETRPAWMD